MKTHGWSHRWAAAICRVGEIIVSMLTVAGLACTPAAAPVRDATPSQTPAWERVIADAKREGELLILGPPGADAREALVQGFQGRYPEISVDYTGGSGALHVPKLLQERAAGQFRADLYISGTSTIVADLVPAGAIDPIRPFLVGPELQDPSKWTDGRFEFADNAEVSNLVFASNVKSPFAYDPRQVSAADFRSWWDLTDPKWRGRMAMRDPRIAGPGQATATHLFTTPGLGPAYLEALLANGVVLSNDDRQILDWVARGQYPIAIAHSDLLATELKERGVPIEQLSADALREGSYLTPGFASVAAVNQAPHPNAAKLYLNWMLSQEGQTDWTKASGYTSRRLDAPRDHLPEFVIPKPGVELQLNYKEQYIMVRDELEGFLRATIRS